MPTQFKIPASPAIHVYQQDNFLGADFTSDAANVDETKSPNTVNMIRSVPGKVRKRRGYEVVEDYGACIYGAHHLTTSRSWLIHAGTKLYNYSLPKGRKWVDDSNQQITDYDDKNIILLTGDVEDTVVYEGMAEHRSVSFQLDNKLVILDGTRPLLYDGFTIKPLSEGAYTPTLTIAKQYNGGGTDYEPLNLINPAFIEQFYVAANSTEEGYDPSTITTFQLTFGDLDSTEVEAWVLDSNGEWEAKEETTDFTVDRTAGKVTFLSAPGASPVEGQDNVKIKAFRTVDGYANRINHCTIGAMFGVNGAHDRLFLSGNGDQGIADGKYYSFINYDWFSQQYDPTYFADTWYSKLGADSSAIMGYSIINNYLAAHKDTNETTQSVLLREGNLVDSQPTFRLINSLQGDGAVSKYCFSYLATEPLFLTKLGVYAVTAQDVTGEKYAQNRSYYLNGKLLKEPNLENAFAYTYKDFYLLCINSHVYVLDGLQALYTNKSMPYATRQYAGFYLENIPANAIWQIEDDLYFGGTDGKMYRFYPDESSIYSYNDNGEPISGVWETADINGQLFYKNKTFRYIAMRCTPAVSSSIQIWAEKYGIWNMIKEDTQNVRYFSFHNIVFSKVTFSNDKTQKTLSTKARLKKLDKVRFRFINEKVNEPFGLNNFALEYTQNGNHK